MFIYFSLWKLNIWNLSVNLCLTRYCFKLFNNTYYSHFPVSSNTNLFSIHNTGASQSRRGHVRLHSLSRRHHRHAVRHTKWPSACERSPQHQAHRPGLLWQRPDPKESHLRRRAASRLDQHVSGTHAQHLPRQVGPHGSWLEHPGCGARPPGHVAEARGAQSRQQDGVCAQRVDRP